MSASDTRVAMAAKVVIGAMLVAAAANLVTFAAVDERARHNYTALHRYETGDVIEIAVAHDTSARQRVAPFVAFGALFPGATVVVPVDGVVTWFEFEPSMWGFGRVASIERLDYDATVPPDLEALATHRVAAHAFAPDRGSTLRVIEARVGFYAGSAAPRRFVVFTPDGPPEYEGFFALVDADLLPDAWRLAHGLRIER